jgi:hypothetical protein
MMRGPNTEVIVDTPTSQPVTVEIEWIGRRLAELPRRTRARLWFTREGREARRRRKGRDRWWDSLDLPFGLDGDDLLVVAAVVAVAVVGVLLWQVLFGAVLLALLEALVLVPLALLALVAKVLFRRPWRVVVRGCGLEVAHVDVRGLRRARAVRDELRCQAVVGGELTPESVSAMVASIEPARTGENPPASTSARRQP